MAFVMIDGLQDLFITNLEYSVTEHILRHHIQTNINGITVERCSVPLASSGLGRNRGIAFVTVSTNKDTPLMFLCLPPLAGRELRVRLDHKSKQKRLSRVFSAATVEAGTWREPPQKAGEKSRRKIEFVPQATLAQHVNFYPPSDDMRLVRYEFKFKEYELQVSFRLKDFVKDRLGLLPFRGEDGSFHLFLNLRRPPHVSIRTTGAFDFLDNWERLPDVFTEDGWNGLPVLSGCLPDVFTEDGWNGLPLNNGVLSGCLVHKLVFPEKLANEVFTAVKSLQRYHLIPADSHFYDITEINLPRGFAWGTKEHDVTMLNDRLKLLTFEVLFKLESLLARAALRPHDVRDQKFCEILVANRAFPAACTAALDDLVGIVDSLHGRKFEHFEMLDFSRLPRLIQQRMAQSTAVASETSLPVRHAIVTPMSVYFGGPTIEASNRVLRQCSRYADRFLRVQFVEENMDSLTPGPGTKLDRVLNRRIRLFLKYGMRLAGRHYRFLAFSSSQLREHSCWFFCDTPDLTVEHIRGRMGNFGAIKIPAKYAARMGQCFSTTISTVRINLEDHEEESDIERNGYCFTDGCGHVSQKLAENISREYNIAKGLKFDDVPSAFQIRLGGCKGVIVVNPDLNGTRIITRPSMNKFPSNSVDLEVCQTSRVPTPGHMNRQFITILESLGVPCDHIVQLQKRAVETIMNMTTDKASAFLALRDIANATIVPMVTSFLASGLNLDDDPVILGILHNLKIARLEEIKSRARIPVPGSYLIFGVADVTGCLGPDEIFIQICKPAGWFDGTQVLESPVRELFRGRVLVTRSPAFHPGDVRILNAVDKKELHHISNCIVFSSEGDRPVANMLSGGDLDGDDFFVTQDEQLFFSGGNRTPMDYTPPEPETVNEMTISHVANFFIAYMKNDKLGIIANAHLATADKESQGAYAPKCLKLASLHSVAVDFAKTGVPVAALERELIPRERPDFMESGRNYTTYESPKVLGTLYRQIELSVKPKKSDSSSEYRGVNGVTYVAGYDGRFIHPEFESYTDEAAFLLEEYNERLEVLMRQFGVRTEAEMLSGKCRKIAKLGRRRRHEAQERINGAFANLRKEFRDCFAKRCDNDFENENAKAIASAWYHVAYTHVFGGSDKVLLSFPWVVHDVLLMVFKGADERLRELGGR